MARFYDKKRKGMKRAKSGKYYYPRRARSSVPKSKRAMVAARAPIVEVKRNESGMRSGYLSSTSPGQFYPIKSFQNLQQGLSQDDMTGNVIFSKYLKMKMKFRFPRDEYSIQKNFRIQVIHGWMTAPFSLASTPVGTPYSPARESVTKSELEQIIAARIGDDYNSTGDDMNFNRREKKLYKIEGKKWLTPNRNNQIGFAQQFGRYASETDHLIGGIPDITHSIQWSPMRRVRYQKSTPTNGDPAFYYPNESWVPFVVVFCPEYSNLAGITNEHKVQVYLNDCHWFTDS